MSNPIGIISSFLNKYIYTPEANSGVLQKDTSRGTNEKKVEPKEPSWGNPYSKGDSVE